VEAIPPFAGVKNPETLKNIVRRGAHLGHVGATGVENIEDLREGEEEDVFVSTVRSRCSASRLSTARWDRIYGRHETL
jgi:hypothetical protein